MKTYVTTSNAQERGVALITSLLAMTMVLALGMALVLSVTTDTKTTTVHRAGEGAFYVADAGIGIARRSMTQALAEAIEDIKNGNAAFYRNNPPAGTGQFPDVQMIPTPNGTWDGAFYQGIHTRATELARNSTRDEIFDDLNGGSFEITFNPPSGNVSLVTSSPTQATQVIVLLYSIDVRGRTTGGGSTVVSETGRLSTNVTLASAPTAGARSFAFSGFGAFFDNGDTQANAPLASGIFSGPVHTNTHFAFLANRSVTFRNVVSQVDNQIRYDTTNNTTPNRAIPNTNITGINISSEGYKRIGAVPLPDNNFSQEYAVINSTGVTDIDSSTGLPVDAPAVIPTSGGSPVPVFDANGRVTQTVMAANLRTVSNAIPTLNGSGNLPNGVYIPTSDGSTISGAGIYVQGDAADIKVYANTSDNQVYVITQGSTVTTVTSNYTTNQTTVSNGSTSRTYSGLFINRADSTAPKNGASLFVNGSINSLRGGKDSSTNRPAIAPKTALTVTAQRHITITGDIKYTNPVVNSDGTPVTNINSIENVMGIFTNDGNVSLAPVSANVSAGSSLGLEMNAAVISFNANTSNDGGNIEGSIAYKSGHTTPGSTARWKLVGSRVQSKINSIGYNYRDVFFDVRFSGGKFAPPFFPGTTYDLGPPVTAGVVTVAAVDSAAATAMSWFRQFN